MCVISNVLIQFLKFIQILKVFFLYKMAKNSMQYSVIIKYNLVKIKNVEFSKPINEFRLSQNLILKNLIDLKIIFISIPSLHCSKYLSTKMETYQWNSRLSMSGFQIILILSCVKYCFFLTTNGLNPKFW